MKKIFLLFVFGSMLTKVCGQMNVYHQFPDSNATWNITATGCCWADCGGPPSPNPVVADYWFSHYINGDTIINSITYRKLYKSGSTHTHCASPTSFNSWTYYDDYFIAFREDTTLRKVYYVSPTLTMEGIWYDFSAGVGDTVCPWDPCTIVSSIDSVLIGSTYRKRFNLAQPAMYYIVEGMGSTAGLMEPACPFEYSATLVCFTQDGQTLFPDTLTTCDLITSQNPLEPNSTGAALIPNPFSDYTTMQLDREVHNATLIVINSLGQIVAQEAGMEGSSISFDGNLLPEGIYLFQLVEDGEVVTMMRGVIAD